MLVWLVFQKIDSILDIPQIGGSVNRKRDNKEVSSSYNHISFL